MSNKPEVQRSYYERMSLLAADPLDAIQVERTYQDRKWGRGEGHTIPEWMIILQREVGESAEAASRAHWGDQVLGRRELREELVQVAAVCVAFIEQLDEELAGMS